MFLLRHVCALLSQTLVTGAILKGGQDTTRARKMPENKCEGFLHGSLSRVGMIRRVIQVAQITLPIHPDNPHLTTTTRHVMVGITRSKVIFGAAWQTFHFSYITLRLGCFQLYNFLGCLSDPRLQLYNSPARLFSAI